MSADTSIPSNAQALRTLDELVAAYDEYMGTMVIHGMSDAEIRQTLERVTLRYTNAWANARQLLRTYREAEARKLAERLQPTTGL